MAEDIAGKYDSTSEHYDRRYKDIQYGKYAMAMSFLGNVDGAILDVGCGTGLLGEFLGRRIWGIDISLGMLERSLGRVQYVHGDATALPFDVSSFDYVFSFTVLQNIPEHERALQEIKRVLKVGGTCVLTYLNKDRFRHIGDDIERTFQVRHSFVYSEDVFYICTI